MASPKAMPVTHDGCSNRLLGLNKLSNNSAELVQPQDDVTILNLIQ